MHVISCLVLPNDAGTIARHLAEIGTPIVQYTAKPYGPHDRPQRQACLSCTWHVRTKGHAGDIVWKLKQLQYAPESSGTDEPHGPRWCPKCDHELDGHPPPGCGLEIERATEIFDAARIALATSPKPQETP